MSFLAFLNKIITVPVGRDLSLDIFRAFGILCMLAGHVGFGLSFDHFIHAFHMPLFFFVSGLFFTGEKPFNVFISNKAKKILIPYLSFAAFYYIVWLLFTTPSYPWYIPLKRLLWNNSVGSAGGMPIVGALWFLTAFFVANMVYFGINTIRSPRLQFAIVIIVVLAGILCPIIMPTRLPFTLDSGLVGAGFIYCGHKLRVSPLYEKLLNLPFGIVALLSIVLIYLIFFNGYVNMRIGTYSNVCFFWFNALGCILIGINLCKRITLYASQNLWTKKIIACVTVMGRDSLVFLCVNEGVILLLQNVVLISNKLTAHILYLILTLLICYIINAIVQRTKLRLFIGKF